MDNFFNTLIYNIVKLFAHILLGISIILITYPLWALVFFQDINWRTMGISSILGWVIVFIREAIYNRNEDLYDDYKNKKD